MDSINNNPVNDENDDDLSKFPERKKSIHALDKHGFDMKSIEPLLARILQFLMTKALFEERKQDMYNVTRIGNVNFHIDYNKITNQTKLVFDKHPSVWQEKDILEQMNNMEADMLMHQQAEFESFNNPFTY